MIKQKVSLRTAFYQMKNLERLVKGNSRFGGRTDISRGCRCHSRQNIICEQKLAEARILSLTGPIGDDGVLAASLEFWNTDYAEWQKVRPSQSYPATGTKRVFKIATFD